MKELPLSLINELHGVRAFDELSFREAHRHSPVTSIRLHPVKGNDAHKDLLPVAWCSEARYLNERPVFTLDPLYHAGAYYVQEASSMFTGYMFRELTQGKNGLRVLDLCAAPGGKSTHIASILDDSSLLISNDVIRSRATILEENMTRWGYMNTWVTSNDPVEFGKLTGYFDVIIVDAPCSGSGLFRKDERALSAWSEDNVNLCSERQQRILANILPALKQEGLLIYATCSYSQQENEQIIDWLADTYRISGIEVPTNGYWSIVKTTSPKNQLPGYRFFPDKINGEGFFIAALRKNEQTGMLKPLRQKHSEEKNIRHQSGHLLKDIENVMFFAKKNSDGEYCAIRSEHTNDLQLLESKLYFRKTGITLGSPSAKEWLPAHDIALSVDASPNIPFIEATKEEALKFLKKEETGLQPKDRGWCIVRYEGLGLGWIKSLGNRTNNYLPKTWRIRMEIPED